MTKKILSVIVGFLAIVVYTGFVFTHNLLGVLITLFVYVFLGLLIEIGIDEKDN